MLCKRVELHLQRSSGFSRHPTSLLLLPPCSSLYNLYFVGPLVLVLDLDDDLKGYSHSRELPYWGLNL